MSKKTAIALVGEAWGEDEEQAFRLTGVPSPFVGYSGRLLNEMLEAAGIRREEIFVTNVFNSRPPDNKVDFYFDRKVNVTTRLPPIRTGKYLRDEFLSELDRLQRELTAVNPNIVIACGNSALWALCRCTPRISKLRGTVMPGVLVPYKILPTYHPAAVARQWELRPTVIMDLRKAKRESTSPEFNRLRRDIFIPESVFDLRELHSRFMAKAERVSIDIETEARQITSISFSPSPTVSIVVPFWDYARIHWWRTFEEERIAWRYVQRWCASPCIVGQNFIYDLTYLTGIYGIRVPHFCDDTMLLHHALMPEAPKSLDYLGSIYCNEIAWKLLNPRNRGYKKDD